MIAYTRYASDARVRREAEALADRGDQVDFICVQEQNGRTAASYGGVRLYPISASRYQGDSTFVYLWIYLSFLFRSFVLVTRLFFKNRYDIIQVHTMPDFLVFAALIPKLCGAKVILDVHDLMPELYICKFGPNRRRLFVKFITWIERRSIAFADRAIAVHIPHRDALVHHGNSGDKFIVLLNVPDPHIFERNGHDRSDRRFRLIYHGTVARRHGLEVALRAVASIKGQIPNLEFLVIGHGDDLPRIKRLAEELELQGCVRFLGTMPVEQLPSHLVEADIGLVPILYDTFTRYMLPLKLMEYARMGIPAIVSDTETIRAYFDSQMVRFCKPGNEQDLADAILELYRSPERRSELVRAVGRFNSTYNWDQQKKVYFELVDGLVGSGPEKTKKHT
jgi:glycosyltransferase involved in cell wall biosynthesis